jgi:HNH endonuclease
MSALRFRAGKRLWEPADDALLTARYLDVSTSLVARELRRSVAATYGRAQKLGLKKSAAYLVSPVACRLRRGDNVGAGTRFRKGNAPANKGLRRPGWGPGRMKQTQFKKGERNGVAVRLYRPIGTERISVDGYLERKVNDDLPLQRRWRAVHLLVWEAANGPVPKGHAIAFRNGDKRDIRIENLECITRRALMARNTVHNLPKPLADTIQLLGALKRQIRRRTKAHEKQDRRSAEPPLRDARGSEGHGQADGA